MLSSMTANSDDDSMAGPAGGGAHGTGQCL